MNRIFGLVIIIAIFTTSSNVFAADSKWECIKDGKSISASDKKACGKAGGTWTEVQEKKQSSGGGGGW
jgi:hypothetical protein